MERLVTALALAALAGCSSTPNQTRPPTGIRGIDKAERSVAQADLETRNPSRPDPAKPAAFLGGSSISWSEISPALAEAAGAIILEEKFLDRLAEQEMKLRGLTLEPNAVAKEQELLAESLAQTAGVPTNQQSELINQLRRSRGLGDTRYAALLKRSAMFRRMIRDEVTVPPADVQQAWEIKHGQQFVTRLIIAPTERQAADAYARLQAHEPFADVALTTSTDPSRTRGGLIGNVSPADPSYPMSLRKALTKLHPGEHSTVIALDQGYAILQLERITPADNVDLASVSASLEREVRLVRERAAMDRLAAQLLRNANISVMDPSLDWSWKGRQR